jgi:hypothetical protein
VLLHQDFLRSTRLKRPRRNKIAKTILANHADGDMDFAIRAAPAAETDSIAKTVIHPNIFAFTSTHFKLRYVLLPMRFSPGDFHFIVGVQESLRKGRRDWQKWHLVLPMGFRAETPEDNRIRPLF